MTKTVHEPIPGVVGSRGGGDLEVEDGGIRINFDAVK